MKKELANHVSCKIKTCSYDTFTLEYTVEALWMERLKKAVGQVATSKRCFVAFGNNTLSGTKMGFTVTFVGDKANGYKLTPSEIKNMGYALQGEGCLSDDERRNLARDAERAGRQAPSSPRI